VADEHDRPGHALERPVERRDIVGERCQRQRRRDRFDPISLRAAMITFAQLDPSAQAPWTSTTLTSFEDIATLLAVL
jgi:hypothetical protein